MSTYEAQPTGSPGLKPERPPVSPRINRERVRAREQRVRGERTAQNGLDHAQIRRTRARIQGGDQAAPTPDPKHAEAAKQIMVLQKMRDSLQDLKAEHRNTSGFRFLKKRKLARKIELLQQRIEMLGGSYEKEPWWAGQREQMRENYPSTPEGKQEPTIVISDAPKLSNEELEAAAEIQEVEHMGEVEAGPEPELSDGEDWTDEELEQEMAARTKKIMAEQARTLREHPEQFINRVYNVKAPNLSKGVDMYFAGVSGGYMMFLEQPKTFDVTKGHYDRWQDLQVAQKQAGQEGRLVIADERWEIVGEDEELEEIETEASEAA